MSSMPKPKGSPFNGVVRPREGGYTPRGNKSPLTTERSTQNMPAQTASTGGMEGGGNNTNKNKA